MAQTYEPLNENPHVKELLALLDKHNPSGAADLLALLGNAAKIEAQLNAAVDEVVAMRRELAAIREENHPLRSVLQNAIGAMQTQILAMREQLDVLKTAIVDGCKNALEAFKERGAAALNNMARFFKVKPALEAIAKSCDHAAKDNAKTIAAVERISKEYHKAGRHVRNIGRAITGKELLTAAKPVGRLARAVQAPLKANRACNLAMRNAARNAVKRLRRLEKAHPQPIKEQLSAAAKQAAAHNARTPDKTKTAPAHDR